MPRSVLVAMLTALVCAAPASAATKNGITPLAPKAGSSIAEGRSPTFRMRVSGMGTVWVHVCRRARRRADGTICATASLGQARRTGDEHRYRPKYYDYASFWLNTPGTYYWQAHRIDCEGGTMDCRQEGPIVRFRVRRARRASTGV